MKPILETCVATRTVCGLGFITLLAPSLVRADETRGQLFDHVPRRAWLENNDPTLVSSRVYSEFSYERYDTGADYYKVENTLRWGVPLKWNETPSDDAFGTGVPLDSESFEFKLLSGFHWYF